MIPNLYSHGSRIVCLSRVMSDMVRGAFDREIADILAARGAFAEREDVDAERIAVAGFCQGGGFALIAATKPGFKAAAVNYGDVPKDRAKLDGRLPGCRELRLEGPHVRAQHGRAPGGPPEACSGWSTTSRPTTGPVTRSSPSTKAGRAGLRGYPRQ